MHHFRVGAHRRRIHRGTPLGRSYAFGGPSRPGRGRHKKTDGEAWHRAGGGMTGKVGHGSKSCGNNSFCCSDTGVAIARRGGGGGAYGLPPLVA